MPQAHKTSFLFTLGLLFLLPLFFIPGGALNLDVAKSALLAFGTLAAGLIFILETWRKGELAVSWHAILPAALLLPVVYAISALLSTPFSLSLLGYNFEIGTFGFMLFGSVILALVAVIFSGTSRALQALAAFFVSISVIAVFVAIKVFYGLSLAAGSDILVWGNFIGNMGNPIGSWTDLAVSFGLLSVFTSLALGMIPMKFSVRILVYAIFFLGTVLLAIINFSTAFILTLVASVLLVIYFLGVENHLSGTAVRSVLKSIFLPVILGLVSIAFLINPVISETRGPLGDVVSGAFRVENIDVRPSFSATLDISKAVLSEGGFLGSGPNTFGRDWLIYKPVDINSTPFWAVAFPFGVGFIPTQVASTGILGTALWLVFFIALLALGVKVLSRIPESRAERFTLVASLLLTFFLWTASFLYTPSATVLILAFIFTGLFVATSAGAGLISVRIWSFKESQQTRLVSSLLIVSLALGGLLLGWAGFSKTVSAFYFKRAVVLSNTAGASLVEIEGELDKAIRFSPADSYYVALSRINFAKAQVAASAATGTPAENQAAFAEALRKSIEAGRLAVSTNPASHENWAELGIIYSALVPEPLAVEGAYENALFAYSEASKRNPLNPEIPLLLARLELNRGEKEAARSFIRTSITLKEDYADAYLMLARLEIEDGNTTDAIVSTERLAALMPDNPGIYFELGLLKYSSRDYVGAAEAFNSALRSTPLYANAKYYLGLALAQLGRLDESQEQFEALTLTNPDSEEVRNILLDLRAGRRSFLDSPVTN